MRGPVVLIDFGSTYTKVAAVDLNASALIGRAQAATTTQAGLGSGLDTALGRLVEDTGRGDLRSAPRYASSSAAGGLRMIVCGLVPRLTSEAARRAALGAGAKVAGVHSFMLTEADVRAIEDARPDMLLMAGGTDGGDSRVVLANALALGRSGVACPIVLAANRVANGEAAAILRAGGKRVLEAANVMPEFGQLELDAARKAIRELFIEHIVRAKGLEQVQRTLEAPVVPTPLAVLAGAELLSQGSGSEAGLGELLLVDVGGATTDVDSIAAGKAVELGLMARGLPEPFAKRTVEGDLGIRFNARHILASAGAQALQQAGDAAVDWPGYVGKVERRVGTLPADAHDAWADAALARTAVELAVSRHAGFIEHVVTPEGDVAVQRGKDLRGVACVIGTGGVFSHGRHARHILQGAAYSSDGALSLRPRDPRYFVDAHYVFYAAGLLAKAAPQPAIRLQKRSLVQV